MSLLVLFTSNQPFCPVYPTIHCHIINNVSAPLASLSKCLYLLVRPNNLGWIVDCQRCKLSLLMNHLYNIRSLKCLNLSQWHNSDVVISLHFSIHFHIKNSKDIQKGKIKSLLYGSILNVGYGVGRPNESNMHE